MITFTELGYYHPSNANWNYRIHLIIDKTGGRLYRETFGGDSRVINKLNEQGKKAEKLLIGKGYAKYSWKEIKDLPDIESYTGENWKAEK
jgi:hypothetical protein